MVDNLNAKAEITLDTSQYVDSAKKAAEANRGIQESAEDVGGAIDDAEKALQALVDGFGMSEEAARAFVETLTPMADRIKENNAAIQELPQAYRQAWDKLRQDQDQFFDQSIEKQGESAQRAAEEGVSAEKWAADERRNTLDQLRQDIISRNEERLAQTKQTLEGEVSAEKQAAEDRRQVLDQLKRDILANDEELNRAGERYAAESRDYYRMEAEERRRQSDLIKSQMQEQASAINDSAQATRGLAATRYALYDVANTWGIISAATLGAATAVETVGASYEYAFSAVQRVTQTAGAQAAEMKQDLKDLASTIHEEFDSIAEVATLGGQMGVAANEIKEFTRNVTMFGATTSATVQEAATGFGRIAQMTKAGSDAWENIGSAIYQVGINSVATESQILRVAQEIATAGNLAGFTTDEVIGLSGALASLNIQPERARGNILRLFSELDKATAEGGERLDLFARSARMSADEFVDAWTNRPEEAFRSLLEGMRAATDEGANLGQMIRDLGIVNVRDVQTMQQLVNNVEVYVSSMGHANEAYKEGSALLEAYGIRSDTVVGKLQILGNVVRNIMDSLSNSSAIKFFLDGFIEIARAIENVLKLPAVPHIAGIGVALLGVVGISAAVRSAMAAMQASILAITLALQHLGTGVIPENRRGIMGLIGSLGELNAVMRGATTGSTQLAAAKKRETIAITENTAAVTGNTVAKRGNVGASTQMAVAGGRVAGAFRTAGSAVTTLVGSLRLVPQLALVSGAIWGISKAINHFSGQADRAKDAAKAFFGDMSGLADAIREDTASYEESGEYMRLLGVAVEDGSIAWDSAKISQEELADAIRDTTEAAEEQIVALGEATQKALMQSIVESENFAETWAKIKDAASAAGIDLKDVVDGIMSGDLQGLLTPVVEATKKDLDDLESLRDRLEAEVRSIEAELRTLDPSDSQQRNDLQDLLEIKKQEHQEAVNRFNTRERELKQVEGLQLATQGLTENTRDLAANQAATAEFSALVGEGLEGASGGADEATESFANLFNELERAHEVEGSLENLVHTLLENGTAIEDMSAEGRASFEALSSTIGMFADQADGDLWAFGTNLAEMFAYAEGAGIEFGNEVDHLRAQMIEAFESQWVIDLSTADARGSIQAFIQDAILAVRARAELEREAYAAKLQSTPSLAAAVHYSQEMQNIQNIADQQVRSLEGIAAGLSKVADRGAQAANNFYNPPGRGGGGGRGGRSPIGKDAKEAAKEVRTLSDYVKDLGSVMKDAFQFRFGMVIATDDLEAAKRSLREMKDDALKRVVDAFESLADARQRVIDLRVSLQDLQASITGLQADKSKLEYFYSIAVEYGDTARAEQIAAQLAKVNADLAKAENDRVKAGRDLEKSQKGVSEASEELSQAQADSKRTLTENTQSSAEQRKAVMDLLKAYQDQIIELANTGASQEEVSRRTQGLRREFEKELTQLGYNRAEVKKYSDSFKDLTTIIKKVPRNITVNTKANTSPAQRALNEWIAKTRKRSVSVGLKASVPKSLGRGNFSSARVGGNLSVGGSVSASRNLSVYDVTARKIGKSVVGGGGGYTTAYSSGGFTGPGGKYQAAGTVHRGEYVFPKKDVNQTTGLPHADVMARMMVGTREFNQLVSGISGSQGNGSVFISGASAGFIQTLANALQNKIVIGDKVIAGANSSANRQSTNVGAN